jgi:hypothetical protein
MTLEVLPAEEGDCLLLTCHAVGSDRYVLIDAGTPSTAKLLLARLNDFGIRRIELVVVSHIDTDHIGGMVQLLRDPEFDCEIGDAWFNGFRHIPKTRTHRAPADAERLTATLIGAAAGKGRQPRELPWNLLFSAEAVVRTDDDPRSGPIGPLPQLTLPWGLKVTLLSPTPKRLDALFNGWNNYLQGLYEGQPSPQTEQAVRRAVLGASLEELAAQPTVNDKAPPNGSSIAFIAEFGGRSILFGADAFPTVLYPALFRLARERAGLPADTPEVEVPALHVDVFKLPHHGSRANVASPLFDIVRADHYVVSTSGKRFAHPDEEAMARVIVHGRPAADRRHTLWFNYASATTRRWMSAELKDKYRYATDGAVDDAASGATLRI